MITLNRLWQILLVLALFSCNNAHQSSRQWYKGNLHTHSYWSDGDEYPEMIMKWYKEHGYNFVGLSDHNILAEGEKWVKVTNSTLYQQGFDDYLKTFGKDWVRYRTDSGRVNVLLKTYEEYKPRFEDAAFLILRSEEITTRLAEKPIHMNVTNIQKVILPQAGETVTEIMQRNIDAVMTQRKESGAPMFPHINHPNFYYGVSLQDIIDLHGERFFEVYNGHPLVRNDGDSTHMSTEQMWDGVNIAYIKKGQPLIYGLATDDSHNYHQFGTAYSNAGRGWVMVYSDSLSPAALIRSMEAGQFYSSTGVTLDVMDVNQNTVKIKVHSEPGVSYEIQFIGLVRNEEQTRLLKSVMGSEAEFEILPDHLFVRAKIVSDKIKENPFKEGEFEVAWTQPVTPQ